MTGASAHAMRPRVSAFAVIALLLASVWAYKVLVIPRPYWIMSTDVEMDFAFNSFQVARGQPPELAYHPGTPVYVLGAALTRLLGTRLDALARFLAVAYAIGLAATVAALWRFAAALPTQLPWLLRAAILGVPFLHASSLMYATYWSSEMFLVAVGLLLWASLLDACRPGQPPQTRQLFAAGAWAGLACAVKIVYLPVAAAVLAGCAAMGWLWAARQPARCRLTWPILAAWLAGVVGVALLIAATDFWRSSPRLAAVLHIGQPVLLLAWALGLASHLCGPGSAPWRRLEGMFRFALEAAGGAAAGWLLSTFIAAHRYGEMLHHVVDATVGAFWQPEARLGAGVIAAELAQLIRDVPGWTAAVLLITGLVAARLAWVLRARGPDPGEVGLGVIALLSLTFGLVAGLRNHAVDGVSYAASGAAVRFLTPVAVGTAAGLAWLTRAWVSPPGWIRRSAAAGAVAVLALLAGAAVRDVKAHHRLVAEGWAEKQVIDRRLGVLAHRMGRSPVVAYQINGAVRQPSAALATGSFYTGYRFTKEIAALYPDEGYMRLDWQAIYAPGTRPVDVVVTAESEVGRAGEEFLTGFGTVERWPVAGGRRLVAVVRHGAH